MPRVDRQAIAGDARRRILGARLVVANPDVAVLATVGGVERNVAKMRRKSDQSPWPGGRRADRKIK